MMYGGGVFTGCAPGGTRQVVINHGVCCFVDCLLSVVVCCFIYVVFSWLLVWCLSCCVVLICVIVCAAVQLVGYGVDAGRDYWCVFTRVSRFYLSVLECPLLTVVFDLDCVGLSATHGVEAGASAATVCSLSLCLSLVALCFMLNCVFV